LVYYLRSVAVYLNQYAFIAIGSPANLYSIIAGSIAIIRNLVYGIGVNGRTTLGACFTWQVKSGKENYTEYG
jgi:hypothetical protein